MTFVAGTVMGVHQEGLVSVFSVPTKRKNSSVQAAGVQHRSMVKVEPEALWVDVFVHHSLDPELREFTGSVLALVGEEAESAEPIGEVDGWICWAPGEHSLAEAGDDLDAVAGLLGWVVDQIVEDLGDVNDQGSDAAVLINVPRLEPRYRGHHLLGAVVDQLLDTLQLDPASTVVVVQPEPQREMVPGPDRDRALADLRRHCSAQGFQPWADTAVWWRPIGRFQP